MMHYPTVAAMSASALALIYTVLTVRVGLLRVRKDILIGDGGDTMLRRRIRAHANFAEYVPLVLILLMLVEGTGAPDFVIVGAAGVFVMARTMHAIGLSTRDGNSIGRAVGALGTVIVLTGCAVWLTLLSAQLVLP
ncbi:MAG: MAPEG family protein [Hyphomicrobiaceae bacterium]|nr:MAPEG family protein [Hyphomicrobiaceae bacterium]